MKKNDFRQIAFIAAVLGLLTVSGCKAGISKEDRLTLFKADVIAVDNPKEHFGNRVEAIGINYATITTVDLDNTSGNFDFTGQNISGDSFRLDFTIGGISDWVTGAFYSEDTGGLGGEDWYIRSITANTGAPPITIP
ncbi:MAG: hypothetical protein RQ801_07430 [Spirochaetaceae bacterium]|nr:hypothetical protein [Spirochaetaceae bacterium]MDT8298113.1 hypothetical protein [Spirochaetaceae bacterium]